MKYCIILFALLSVFLIGQAQSVSISSTTGQLNKLSKVTNLKKDDKIKIPFTFHEVIKKRLIDSCKNKLDSTICHLRNTPEFTYLKFFGELWSDQVAGEVLIDLESIKEYLVSGNLKTPLIHLQPFYNKLKNFIDAPAVQWYSVNNTPVTNDTYTLTDKDLEEGTFSYQLEIRLNMLFNNVITDLFKETYTNAADADMTALRDLPFDDYKNESEQLKEMYARVKVLSAYHPNNVNDSAVKAFIKLNSDFNKLVIVKAIRNASFFKNWIWWRNAELTLNPFELRYRDTAKSADANTIFPAFKNYSQLTALTQTDKNFNRILLAQNREDYRLISFFQQKDGIGDYKSELEQPFKSIESIQIAVHNINDIETVDLKLVKTTPHNGANNTINGLDSAFTIWGRALTSLNPAAIAWAELMKTFRENKSLNNAISDDFGLTKAVIPTLTKENDFWKEFEADLKSLGTLNPVLLDEIKNSPGVIRLDLKGKIAAKNKSQVTAVIIAIVNKYNFLYELYMDWIKKFNKDSLVITNIYRLIAETNRPTFILNLHADKGPFSYRTELLYTGTTDDNVQKYYEIKRFRKTDNKTDSALIGSFNYKTAQKQLFGVSIGPAFTIANKYYARNSVTAVANEPLGINTSRELVNFTFGLHIYPWKIFTLDNFAFHSKASPWYTRLSVYAGLGFPKTLEDFYPGISYDIVAGIRIVGGAHCYIHDRFKIVNNVIDDKSSQFRAAGAFFSINIDPIIAVKAIGIIK